MLTVFAIVRMHDLFAIVMLLSIYGFLCASFFMVMDAVDVAFTEAAVGIGISTLLLLSALTLTGRFEKKQRHKPLLAVFSVAITASLLIYGTLQMPPFGSAYAPAHQHIATHYITQSFGETGIINIVTSVLASYRGYDTLGELIVIFTAGMGVLVLLRGTTSPAKDSAIKDSAIKGKRVTSKQPAPMKQHAILRIVSKMLIPLILLFALYVQFHADFGPGGGFQAGVIFASVIILYVMIFGLRATQKTISLAWLEFLAALGVLIFGSVGLLSLLFGENFLDYNMLSSDPVQAQHLGIFVVEIGVGITVAATIILIFMTFTGRMANRGEQQ
ncbi:Na(+)/H(+) antiporter subunit B [Thalassomonas actiniarum]|uniref:Na(+)/H(+) antiporter subunit B n=1 Tax=Thalassomonas actiniarum TaxID=485447 RepID=UPI0022A9A95A|nr:Na(+)/H(+) antiporter subunit B [Thalassomonas actiniarum]